MSLKELDAKVDQTAIEADALKEKLDAALTTAHETNAIDDRAEAIADAWEQVGFATMSYVGKLREHGKLIKELNRRLYEHSSN